MGGKLAGCAVALLLVTLVWAGPAEAANRWYECQVEVGGWFFLVDVLGVSYRGCQLRTTTADATVDEIDAPEGCNVWVDDNGDGRLDRALWAGHHVPAGATIWGVCNLGETLSTVRMSLLGGGCPSGDFCHQ